MKLRKQGNAKDTEIKIQARKNNIWWLNTRMNLLYFTLL